MEIEPDIDFQFPFINVSKIPLSVKLNFFSTKSDYRGFFFINIGLMWVGAIFHWQILPNGSRIQMPWSFQFLLFAKENDNLAELFHNFIREKTQQTKAISA